VKSNIQFGISSSTQKFGLLPVPLSGARFQIAPRALPAYSNCLMGQQHRVTVKRKRRKAYVERKRVAAKAPRRMGAKSRAKKSTAAAS
jgi:hypothetical protein